jgi:hypothetical protein
MSDFDIDLSGFESLQEDFAELEGEWTDSPVFTVESGAEYSIYLEMGTRDMPPYPFFRPAIREFRANPRSFILEHTEYSRISDIPDVDELVTAVAQSLERQMKLNATAQASGRSPGTDADHPQVQTDNLRARIQARRVG